MKKSLAPGLLVLLALAGCTSPEPAPGPAASPTLPATATASPAEAVDQDDVMFAQMMIPHHEQAVEMSDIILGKPNVSDDVRRLAEDIRAAQQPEIETMQGWLSEWGAPAMAGHGDGEGHGSMDGMLTEEQMNELREADTARAEELFLRGMIEHHDGAVTMAENVKKNGTDPRVQRLADEIIQTQQVEIDTMEQLLQNR